MIPVYLSIALFALSAILGLLILLKWMKKQKASRAVIFAHGLVAIPALILLFVYATGQPDRFPTLALTLFSIAAVAGMYMFAREMNHLDSPLSLAVVHGAVAVAGFIALLFCVFG
jgi:hypothetical protein